MALKRAKRRDIYDVTRDFYMGGNVRYVAHAVLENGTAILLRPTLTSTVGRNAFSHPDQEYWRTGVVAITNAIRNHSQDVKRIEIDCTLMPCTGQNGCTDNVPSLICKNYPMLRDKALRVFSHRGEFPTTDPSQPVECTKRYFDTTVSKGTNHVISYNGHKGWGWVPETLSRAQYANDYQAII